MSFSSLTSPQFTLIAYAIFFLFKTNESNCIIFILVFMKIHNKENKTSASSVAFCPLFSFALFLFLPLSPLAFFNFIAVDIITEEESQLK